MKGGMHAQDTTACNADEEVRGPDRRMLARIGRDGGGDG